MKGVCPRRAQTLRRSVRRRCKVVDLDARASGAELVTTVALEHGLHQLVLHPPGSPGRDPEPPAQLDAGQALLALGEQVLRVTSVKLV